MVNENLIPKTEEIREIKNEIPSYEEFMKTYQSDKAVVDGFNSEINSYNDLGVEKIYGPSSGKGKEKRSEQHFINTLNKLGTFDERDW